MDEMKVVAPHMVGKFKYIILHNLAGEEKPAEVYLTEANINVKPYGYVDYGDCLTVTTKYKAIGHGCLYQNLDAKDVFDTKEEALKRINEVNTWSVEYTYEYEIYNEAADEWVVPTCNSDTREFKCTKSDIRKKVREHIENELQDKRYQNLVVTINGLEKQ